MAADRIAELERLIAQTRRQTEEARQRAEEERHRAEEARQRAEEARQRAEEERQRADEASRQADEASRRAEEEMKRANSEAEARRKAEARVANLPRQLNNVRSGPFDPQNLRNYLNQIRHLSLHTSRLLPIYSESNQLSSLDASNDSNVAPATSAQTSIKKKVYPLRVRPWTEFPEEHSKVFSSLQGRLKDACLFPPRKKIEILENLMEDRIPVAFLQSNWFLNHARTSGFLDHAVEEPCSNILIEHFAISGQKKEVFFDNKRPNEESILGSSANTSQGLSDDTISGPDTVDGSDTAAQRPAGKTIPDCLVWVKDGWIDRSAPRPEPYVLTIGEHKSCHSLRAKDLQNNPTLPEDCLIRMAIASKSQLGKGRKDQKSKHQQSDSTVFSPIAPSDIPQELQFFASALAQTYHFMIMSGLEYGYLATGETLTLLRVPLEDPATLLYYTSLFPAVDPKDLPKSHGYPVYPSGVTASVTLQDVPQIGDDGLAELAVSQLCSLCIMASTSAVRSVAWVNEALGLLAEFPNLPKSHGDVMASSLGTKSHNDSDNESDGNCGSRRLPNRSTMHRVDDSHELAASPLRQTHQAPSDTAQHHRTSGDRQAYLVAAGIKAVKEKAMLPYCTQACLLGLVRGLSFDTSCPNYEIHKNALLQSSCAKPQEEHQKHGISGDDVCRLVQEQIAIHPENNCALLYNEGLHGAIGRLFKLSINGYGYTFVAKGVESHNVRRLKRETRIYNHLHQQQGVLIPVHLGLVKLLSPYPFMARFTTLSHLMLMSYTGKSLQYGSSLDKWSQELGRDVEQEVVDTYQKLQDWGLSDGDHDVCNATWCEELQSVMKIDFDHCALDMDVYEAKSKAVEGSLEGSSASRKRIMVGDPDDGQISDDEVASVTDIEPVLKRAKHVKE